MLSAHGERFLVVQKGPEHLARGQERVVHRERRRALLLHKNVEAGASQGARDGAGAHKKARVLAHDRGRGDQYRAQPREPAVHAPRNNVHIFTPLCHVALHRTHPGLLLTRLLVLAVGRLLHVRAVHAITKKVVDLCVHVRLDLRRRWHAVRLHCRPGGPESDCGPSFYCFRIWYPAPSTSFGLVWRNFNLRARSTARR